MKTNYFDRERAASYDRDSARMFADEVLEPTVAVLEELCDGGAALEFAIGTGRVALPLSERGIKVHGIDLSEDMLDQLRLKPGCEDLSLTTGDITSTRVEGSFKLVYLVFNTICNLTSQEAQVACFRNAADHLEPGGCFVIENGVPGLRHLPPGIREQPFQLGQDYVGFDVYTDFSTQAFSSHHIWNDDGKFRQYSTPFRWVWPSELDLMAQLAGMHLESRWSNFLRAPFTEDSRSHVSVWRLPV